MSANIHNKKIVSIVLHLPPQLFSFIENSTQERTNKNAKIFFIAVQLGEAPPDYDPVDLGDSTGAGSPDYSGVDNFYNQVF